MAGTAAKTSSYRNILLHIIIWALGAVDKITRGFHYVCNRLVAGPGKAKPGGSNPAPPKTMGIIITEPNIADVSLRTVANIAVWCMSHGVRQVHLYDPSGHLKRSQSVLADNLQTAALQAGSTVILKCGWSVADADAVPPQCDKSLQLPAPLEVSAPAAAPAAAAAAGRACAEGSKCLVPQQLSTSSKHVSQEDLVGIADSSHKSSQHLNGLGHQQPLQAALNGHQYSSWWSRDNQQHLVTGKVSTKSNPTLENCPAGNGINSSSSSSGSQGPAVTVRLLSAEDGYDPVIAAALERCAAHIIPGSSPRANSLYKPSRGKLHLLEGSNGSNASCGCCSSDVEKGCSSKKLCVCSRRAQTFSRCCGAPASAVAAPNTANAFQHSCRRSSSSSWDVSTAVMADSNRPSQFNSVFSSAVAADSKAAARHELQLQPGLQQVNDHGPSCDCGQDISLKNGDSRGVFPLLDSPETDQHLCQQQQQQQQVKEQCLTKLAVSPQSLNMHSLQQQKQDGSILPELAAIVNAEILLEPQLLLVFGPVLSLAGYPPFHSRACEVHFLGSLASASRQKVANAIAGYCKVLQRHGT